MLYTLNWRLFLISANLFSSAFEIWQRTCSLSWCYWGRGHQISTQVRPQTELLVQSIKSHLIIIMSLSNKCSVSLSYPYSEEYTKPTQYMNTRCPAWCDRILMSHTAQEFIHKVSHCLWLQYHSQCWIFCMFSVFSFPRSLQNIVSVLLVIIIVVITNLVIISSLLIINQNRHCLSILWKYQ